VEQGVPVGDAAPHGEALTLLGAALKYNGLSYEQGFRSCQNVRLCDNAQSPSAFLSDSIHVENFLSFAVDLVDPYLQSDAAMAAMKLAAAYYFNPSSAGCISFESWCLSLLKVDDGALQLARAFKLRAPLPLNDNSSSVHDATHNVYLLPLPPLPDTAQHMSTALTHRHAPLPPPPLPNDLSEESEAQMLLELVSGARAAEEALEAASPADGDFLFAVDGEHSVAGSISGTSADDDPRLPPPLTSPARDGNESCSAAVLPLPLPLHDHAASKVELAELSQARGQLRPPSPAGATAAVPIVSCWLTATRDNVLCRQPAEHGVRGCGVH
jgi:hypothetical protein